MDVEVDHEHEQNLIQQQMEETRASLSNKLEALETQVAETVQTATDAVQTATEAVQSTKDAVAETVETVKDSVGEIRERVGETVRSVASFFDINRQAQERPWVVLGGAVGLGCLAGWYLTSGKNAKKAAARAPAPPQTFADATAVQPAVQQTAPSAPAAEKPSWFSKEVGHLRGLAIGLAMGTLRDLAKQTLPEAFSGRVAEEVDRLTPQFGGEVFQGQILPDLKALGDSLAPEPKQDDTTAHSLYPSPTTEASREKAYFGG